MDWTECADALEDLRDPNVRIAKTQDSLVLVRKETSSQWDQYAPPEVQVGEQGIDHRGFWANLDGMTLDALIRTLEVAKAQGMPGDSEVHVDGDHQGARLLLRS